MLFFVFSIFLSLANAQNKTLECASAIEMGTEFKICVSISPLEKLTFTSDTATAFKLIKSINAWMSDWIDGTELNEINKQSGVVPVKIKPELFNLLQFSQAVSQNTSGAYDPTFNVFWGLYNFKKGSERAATEDEIKERLPLVNYKQLELDSKHSTAYLNKKGMRIGLGAIGQSYAVDEVVKFLKQKNYSAGYVDGSGDSFFWGTKPDGSKWTTGIRNPLNRDQILARYYGTDMGITTAGDDEKYFIRDGKRIHHILDPKTGKPADKLRQVTVIANTALIADAYDTACFVLGLDKCLRVLKQQKLEGFIVTPDGKLHTTPGLKKKKNEWGEYWEL